MSRTLPIQLEIEKDWNDQTMSFADKSTFDFDFIQTRHQYGDLRSISVTMSIAGQMPASNFSILDHLNQKLE